MITENKTIHRCEFCNKYYSISKCATQYHEDRCNNNPKNKHACFGCAHLENITIESGRNEREHSVTNCMRCKATGKEMHSNKTLVKIKRFHKMFSPIGELMPYECKMFSFFGS